MHHTSEVDKILAMCKQQLLDTYSKDEMKVALQKNKSVQVKLIHKKSSHQNSLQQYDFSECVSIISSTEDEQITKDSIKEHCKTQKEYYALAKTLGVHVTKNQKKISS